MLLFCIVNRIVWKGVLKHITMLSQSDAINTLDFICLLLGISTLIVVIPVCTFTYLTAEKQIISNEMRYKCVLSEIEAIDTNNESVSKVEVVKDIYEWNEFVRKKKYNNDSPWLNIFESNKVVDRLEYIDIKEVNNER